MKKFAKVLLPLLVLLFSVSMTHSQSKAQGLQDIVGSKGSSAEYELKERGYVHIKTDKSSNEVYSYWWNNKNKKCVSYRLNDGRVKSIVNTLPADCKKSDSNKKGSNSNKNQDPVKVSDLDNWPAASAYDELRTRGFKKEKEYVGDGDKKRFFTVWYNRNTRQCIKTAEKNGKITEVVEKSDKCNK